MSEPPWRCWHVGLFRTWAGRALAADSLEITMMTRAIATLSFLLFSSSFFFSRPHASFTFIFYFLFFSSPHLFLPTAPVAPECSPRETRAKKKFLHAYSYLPGTAETPSRRLLVARIIFSNYFFLLFYLQSIRKMYYEKLSGISTWKRLALAVGLSRSA